jgi:hypothetical protein
MKGNAGAITNIAANQIELSLSAPVLAARISLAVMLKSFRDGVAAVINGRCF